ncbi:MAG: hypothetical protein M1816_005913 [Peltula sp. TS41687]|nr:MAG: hypothetical protein M1816_005913 [Peltula sp. TS41687]
MSASTTRAHRNQDDINANGEDKKPPCVRCLKFIASTDPLRLHCRVMQDYDGGRKCGRCVGMNKTCFEVPGEILSQAIELVNEYKRVSALPSGPSRAPDVARVKRMSVRFAHREQSYQNQLRRANAAGTTASGSRGIGGRVSVGGQSGRGSVPAVGVANDGGETVKEKLDKVIANGDETNRLLRSIEGLGERLLASSGAVTDSDDDDGGDGDESAGDDGGDAEMAG